MSARFEIFIGRDEKHYFRYVGEADLQILRSEGYEARQGAVAGIDSVKKNSDRDEAYQLEKTQDDRYYFNLVAGNHQIIATSVLFTSTRDRRQAIDDVKKHAATAPTVG